MSDAPFVIPLSSARAADVECVGPKAANLAALARAGLPTPGGFCLGADAYRRQIAELGMQDLLARYNDADVTERRRISVAIRLALYERPVAPAVLEARRVPELPLKTCPIRNSCPARISTPTTAYSALVLPFILSGVGMGMFFAPVANVVLSSVRPEQEGKASGATVGF